MDIKNLILAVTLTVTLPMKMYGQQTDCDSLSVNNRNIENYQFEWRQTILPASLIGVGAVALAPSFIRNGSRNITNNVIDIRGNNKRLEFDDYIQYLPVASSLMLGYFLCHIGCSYKRSEILHRREKTGVCRTQLFSFRTYCNRFHGCGTGTDRIRQLVWYRCLYHCNRNRIHANV